MRSECRVYQRRKIIHMWMSTRKEIKYCRGKYSNFVILTLIIYWSTFIWTLLKGYDGDGFSCSDINECETGDHECDLNADCINTEGSYTCKCSQGKRWNIVVVNTVFKIPQLCDTKLIHLFVFFYLNPLKRFWRWWFFVLRYKRMCNWRSWLRWRCRVY